MSIRANELYLRHFPTLRLLFLITYLSLALNAPTRDRPYDGHGYLMGRCSDGFPAAGDAGVARGLLPAAGAGLPRVGGQGLRRLREHRRPPRRRRRLPGGAEGQSLAQRARRRPARRRWSRLGPPLHPLRRRNLRQGSGESVPAHVVAAR